MATEKPNLDELAPTEQSFEELRSLIKSMKPGEQLVQMEPRERIKKFGKGMIMVAIEDSHSEQPRISIEIFSLVGKWRIGVTRFDLTPKGLQSLSILTPDVYIGKVKLASMNGLFVSENNIYGGNEGKKKLRSGSKVVVDWVRRNLTSEKYLPPPISLFPKGFVKNPENPELQVSS